MDFRIPWHGRLSATSSLPLHNQSPCPLLHAAMGDSMPPRRPAEEHKRLMARFDIELIVHVSLDAFPSARVPTRSLKHFGGLFPRPPSD